MSELIARYVKLVVVFVLLWVGMTLSNSLSCRKVSGPEMEPTLKQDTFMTVSAAKFRPHEHILHDDLVSFEYDRPGEPERPFFARVIGLPGDRVRIVKGEVHRNGQKVDQSYVAAAMGSLDSFEEIVVPRAMYFVLMDNRKASPLYDSRGVGLVGQYAVVGKVNP